MLLDLPKETALGRSPQGITLDFLFQESDGELFVLIAEHAFTPEPTHQWWCLFDSREQASTQLQQLGILPSVVAQRLLTDPLLVTWASPALVEPKRVSEWFPLLPIMPVQ